MAMASRAVYSNLDPTYPGLIKAIVQNELRGRLGFTGVTINDAMEEGVLGALLCISSPCMTSLLAASKLSTPTYAANNRRVAWPPNAPSTPSS
jgi:hypothetical protein